MHKRKKRVCQYKKNQFNNIMLPITMRAFCTCIHFCKTVVSNHDGSKEAICRDGGVPHVLQRADQRVSP